MSKTYCGFIGLIGRPNVGKSTLLNRLVGQKVCITSNKPQTTRDRIMGVKTEGNYQFVYVDTPGIHDANKKALNKALNKTARRALSDLDVILFMVEASRWDEQDAHVKDLLLKCTKPIIVIVNKVDLVKSKETLLPRLAFISEFFPESMVLPLSAEKGDNVDVLESKLKELMPENPFYFFESDVSDRDLRFRSSEFIREQIFRRSGQELPYASAVQIETFEEREGLMHIHAIIWVEREGQKRIIIGDKGQKLKEIGTNARLNIEAMIQRKVYLNLWVKIKENWSDNSVFLSSIGLME